MEILMHIGRGMLGLAFLVGFCYLLSNNKKNIDWMLVIKGIAIQLVIGLLVLKVPAVASVFELMAGLFTKVLGCSSAGAEFLFGDLARVNKSGFIFAFQVLPTIVFFSALSSALYYLGILQFVVKGFAWVMTHTMRLTGAESLAAAANIFMGQTEAPLVIKPYVKDMSPSELMCLMTGGMATIAGSVFAAYVLFLGGNDPALQKIFATHLLTASILSAPAAIVAAKILYPETNKELNTHLDIPKSEIGSNFLEALSRGTTDGLKLAVNVAAMLLAFTAMIFLLNKMLMLLGDITYLNGIIAAQTDNQYQGLSFQYIMGMIGAPVAWILGTPSQDIVMVGQLLGTKTTINEFVAYADLETLKYSLTPKGLIIATYALCGFSNFASIGIQIGGIGSLAPNRISTLASLGIKSLIGGSVACFMTAAIAGMMVQELPTQKKEIVFTDKYAAKLDSTIQVLTLKDASSQLVKQGVSSYSVDLLGQKSQYYTPDGKTFAVARAGEAWSVADSMDTRKLGNIKRLLAKQPEIEMVHWMFSDCGVASYKMLPDSAIQLYGKNPEKVITFSKKDF